MDGRRRGRPSLKYDKSLERCVFALSQIPGLPKMASRTLAEIVHSMTIPTTRTILLPRTQNGFHLAIGVHEFIEAYDEDEFPRVIPTFDGSAFKGSGCRRTTPLSASALPLTACWPETRIPVPRATHPGGGAAGRWAGSRPRRFFP